MLLGAFCGFSPIFALPENQTQRIKIMNNLFYVVPAIGLIGLLFTAVRSAWVSRQDAGNERMTEIARHIAEGAMAFLKAEYKILTYFVVIAALLLGFMGESNANYHWQ